MMIAGQPQIRLTRKLIDSLYVEAMVLADEARAYFDRVGNQERDELEPVLRVTFSCESLKVTTRLMHIIAWLLTRRSLENGEESLLAQRGSSLTLGHAVATELSAIARLPAEARQLIVTSCELYERVRKLDDKLDRAGPSMGSPARALMRQLEEAF